MDICVHSLKDVPAQENPLLPIGAYSQREAPADVLVLPQGQTRRDPALPVGCAGARRAMQFQKLFPDAVVKPVRGNVLTRLEKLDRGEYGALLLAEAGLNRLRLAERISYRFSPEEMVPAAGQGIMAIQTRAGEYAGLLRQLNHEDAAFCAGTERRLSGLLGGDCSAPVGCYAKLHGDDFTLYGFSGRGFAGADPDPETLPPAWGGWGGPGRRSLPGGHCCGCRGQRGLPTLLPPGGGCRPVGLHRRPGGNGHR